MRAAKVAPDSMVRAADLTGTTQAAAAKALARLAQRGVLIRISSGLYFAPKETLLGMSQPSEFAITRKRLAGKTRPTGATAANLLGLSTQVPARLQIVAFTSNKPIQTGVARIRLRRGVKPHPLPEVEGALLEFIRDRGKYSELESTETYFRLRELLGQRLKSDRLLDLCAAALEEPPRVRAILGALLEFTATPVSLWHPLKTSLNPLTRFDFGIFRELPNARKWQAR